jgi:hypothetical protein
MSDRTSKYLDGAIPGKNALRVHESDDRTYLQPEVDISDVGQAAEIEDESRSICQRIEEEMANAGILDWIKRNQSTIITVAAIYGGYRIIRG